jgi:hypothetical protein
MNLPVLDTERRDPDRGSKSNSHWHIMKRSKRTTYHLGDCVTEYPASPLELDFRMQNKVNVYRALTTEVACPLRL